MRLPPGGEDLANPPAANTGAGIFLFGTRIKLEHSPGEESE